MTSEPPAIGQPGASPPPREYAGLLNDVMTHTLDEDYATVADQRRERPEQAPEHPSRHRVALLASLTAFGLLVGVSALKTDQDRPETEAERAGLISQIHNRQDAQEDLSRAINAVGDDVTALQRAVGAAVSRNSTINARLQTLGVDAGTLTVAGPGLVITADDGPADQADSGGTILDTDLQGLVNGLWDAGAEAIAIDGHRLTTLTAIRFAGQAITVDNVSLTAPYEITAIGDPGTLPARLLETTGGQTWLGLQANFGIQFDRDTSDRVDIPGDPHEHLLYAKPEGER